MDYKWTPGARVHWKKISLRVTDSIGLSFRGWAFETQNANLENIWHLQSRHLHRACGGLRWTSGEFQVTTFLLYWNHDHDINTSSDPSRQPRGPKMLLATRGARSITLFCWFSRDHRQICVSLKPRAHHTADHWKMRYLLALGLACRGNRRAVSKHCCYNTGQCSETAKGTLDAGVHSTKLTHTGATNLVLFIENYQLFRECVPCVVGFATLTNIHQLQKWSPLFK